MSSVHNRANRRSFSAKQGLSLALLPLAGVLLPATQATAQVISSSDDVGTSVEVTGDFVDINGGQISDEGSNLFHSFEQFDLTSEQTANFTTVPDVQNVVGRVAGGGASTIDGTLQVSGSDANLYLMNPAGVLMGPNAQLNLPGSFTATTATGFGFENGEFGAVGSDYAELNGEPTTFNFDGAQAGAVVNLGELSVEKGQTINLIGGTVVNAGELNAPGGSVTMAAVEGDSTVRISQGDQLLSLEVDKNNSALVSNGAITPLSIGEMLTGGGLENATTLVTAEDGTVSLSGSDAVISEAGGEAIASGALNTSGEVGGEINVLGDRVSLLDASLDASGMNGGGLIRVGGDYQGDGSVNNAANTWVDANSTLSADALERGDGGRAIVWADESTHFFGSVSARGGMLGGDGGFSEVSGKQTLIFDGSADLSAAQGKLGRLLLDPQNIVITDGAAPANNLPVTEYRSSASLENAFANIEITAENDIVLENLSDDVLDLRRGVSLTIKADSDSSSTGTFSMAREDTIRLTEGSLDISGAIVEIGNVEIEDGNLDILGNGVELVNADVEDGNINISGAVVEISSIDIEDGNLDISGSSIELASADVEDGNINISGDSIEVTDIKIEDGDIEVTGGWVGLADATSEGGSVSVSGNYINVGNIDIESEYDEEGNQPGRGSVRLISTQNVRVGDITTERGDVFISGADIFADTINTSTNDHNKPDTGAVEAGDVTLLGSGNVTVEEISAYGSHGHHSGNGGDVEIQADGGDITVNQFIKTWSAAFGEGDPDKPRGEGAGAGGSITLKARDNIEVYTGGSTNNSVLLSSSEAVAHDSGNGGTISLETTTGSVVVSGNIAAGTIAGDRNKENKNDNDESDGSSGDVLITAGENIQIRDVITRVVATEDSESNGDGIAGRAGDIELTATTGAITARDIYASALSKNVTGGDGGRLTASAESVVIGNINTASSANAGDVTLTAVNNIPNLDSMVLLRRVSAGSSGSGNDGALLLTGDRIDFLGGANSVAAESVWFNPASVDKDINVGIPYGQPELDILEADLRALGNGVETITVGRADSTGRIIMWPGALDRAADSPSIEILGGQTLAINTNRNIADDIAATFNITGVGEGFLGNPDVAFSNIEELEGGNLDDTFIFGEGVRPNDFAVIDGGGGSQNTIELKGSGGSPSVLNLETTLFENIQRIVGNSSNSKLIAKNINNDWEITGPDSGSVNEFRFEGFSELVGGTEQDRFEIVSDDSSAGAVTGLIDGGGGDNDSLDLRRYEESAMEVDVTSQSVRRRADGIEVGAFENIEKIRGSRFENDRIVSAESLENLFEITDRRSGRINNEFDFLGFEEAQGMAGAALFDLTALTEASEMMLIGNGPGSLGDRVIISAPNADWSIDEVNAGTVADIDGVRLASFEDVENLENISAGNGEQTVLFTQYLSQITGSIDSGASDLTLIGNDINLGRGDGFGNNEGARLAGTGRLSIRPEKNSNEIVLGGSDSQTGNSLSLTDGELLAIQPGFSEIEIGGDGYVGEVRLQAELQFNAPLIVRSQGKLNTTASSVLSSTDSITLNFRQNVTTQDIFSVGDVNVLSQGVIKIDGDILSSGGDVSLSSDGHSLNESAVVVNGTIDTTASDRSGNLNIDVSTGGIKTGGLVAGNETTVRAGSVNLRSPGSISIEFIDAREQGNNSNNRIEIETDKTFVATGTRANSGESISTSGTTIADTRTSITVGNPDIEAAGFSIGNSSRQNSVAGSIDSGSGILSDRDFAGSFARQNIQVTDRGMAVLEPQPLPELPEPETLPEDPEPVMVPETPAPQPIPEEPEPQVIPETPIVEIPTAVLPPLLEVPPISEEVEMPSMSEESTVTPPLAPVELPAVAATILAAADEEGEDVFEQIELNTGNEFETYLGLDKEGKQQERATVAVAQNTLSEVETNTGVKPALVYVYFVPDAESEASVVAVENREPQPEDQLEVMVITQDGKPVQKRQWGVTRQQVEEVGQSLRRETTSQFSTQRQYLPPAQQLYDWIMAPVAKVLEEQSVQSLGFVMDTGLRTLPMAALHNGDRFLVEDYSLGLLPTFSLTNFTEKSAELRDAQVLAMGASKFKNQPDLPAVDAEVGLISEREWKGKSFLNEAFVLDTFQKELENQDYEIVHLATHATFTSGDVDKSYIQLWDEQLPLSEMNELGLSQAEINLMILSACNTAMGDKASEYGFAGFAVNSGAESALASLWPVSDEGTLGFMSEFYKSLRGSSVKADALRQAQISMIGENVGIVDGEVYGPEGESIATLVELAESGQWDFSHPFYWSAFSMIGNPW